MSRNSEISEFNLYPPTDLNQEETVKKARRPTGKIHSNRFEAFRISVVRPPLLLNLVKLLKVPNISVTEILKVSK